MLHWEVGGRTCILFSHLPETGRSAKLKGDDPSEETLSSEQGHM